jgi:hypothetical protein
MGKANLKFTQCGATGGDCTAPYDVSFAPGCTLRDLVSDILQRGEWGYIDIEFPCCLRCEYKGRNVISGSFPEDIQDKVVKRVKAAGGWSNMDYLVWL